MPRVIVSSPIILELRRFTFAPSVWQALREVWRVKPVKNLVMVFGLGYQ